MNTFSNLIGMWPTKSEFASDCGVEYGVAHQWDRRNSIPVDHWPAVIDAAQSRGFEGVNLEALTVLRQNRKLN